MDGLLPRGRSWAVALTLCALTAGGCASWNGAGWNGNRWGMPRIDPTGERIFVPGSFAAPFGSPPVTSFGIGPGAPLPPVQPPTAIVPAPQMAVPPTAGPVTPGVDLSAAKPRLELQLSGPATAKVGSTVRFEAVLKNVSNVLATDLVITDTFDEGLKHLVARSPIEKSLGDIGPGQSQSVYLSFQVMKPGKLCHSFEITGAGGVVVRRQGCLTATAQTRPQPAIEVKKTGPRQLRFGTIAEFTIEIRNTGNVPLTNLRIEDRYDRALEPTHATEGYAVDDEGLPIDEQGRPSDMLFWRLPRLEAGATHKLEVHCKCLAAVKSACNRVTVSCVERPPVAHEACLEILPKPVPPAGTGTPPATEPPLAAEPPQDDNRPTEPIDAPPKSDEAATSGTQGSTTSVPLGPAELKLSIASFKNPARVGDQVKYQIDVTNQGQTSDKGVTLVVKFPAEMRPVQLSMVAPVQYKITDGQITFQPIAELRAGEPLQYVISFEMLRGGTVQLEATLSSDGRQKPITRTETTEIIAR